MQHLPYTLSEAESLCEKLQHLVGYTFDPSNSSIGNVEAIAVSPFDQPNKKKFLLYYMLCCDLKKSLHEEYKGLLYDVIVIARSLDDANELVQYDIETWLGKNKLDMGEVINAHEDYST